MATNVWQKGNDRIVYDDDANTYYFYMDGNSRLEITQEGINGVLALSGNGTIRSDGDLRIHLDKNQATSPTVARLKVFNGDNFEVFTVNERGEVDFQQGGIVTREAPSGEGGGIDNMIRLGVGQRTRGRVEILNQPEIAGEFPQKRKAGILLLYDEVGQANFLWVDLNGKLRISRTEPGPHDASGVVVGTQT